VRTTALRCARSSERCGPPRRSTSPRALATAFPDDVDERLLGAALRAWVYACPLVLVLVLDETTRSWVRA
jgi:hypothetical protein